MDIAERIKKLREKFEITSNEFAKFTGIHPVTVRKYESKKMVPGIEVIDKMCETLKLNRMIFEGIPKQYTDYNFTGDFYQQLFLLLENETLHLNSENKENKNNINFSVNPLLSNYIQIKNGDEIIPLENLTIHFNTENRNISESLRKFKVYYEFLRFADNALKSQNWNMKEHSESREKYASRSLESAQAQQLELMLLDHGWSQYFDNLSSKDLSRELNSFILSGGDFYSYIMQANMPESQKQIYIEAYEEAYIEAIIKSDFSPYPIDADFEVQYAWFFELKRLIEKYKSEHPDYKEKAKEHALSSAKKVGSIPKFV